MVTKEKPSEDRLIEVVNELHELLKERNKITLTEYKIIKPICPHCKVRMLQDEDGLYPPVCENPICPTNDYTEKG